MPKAQLASVPFDSGRDADGARRVGRVFTLRLEPRHKEELLKLFALYEAHRYLYQWPRPTSLGSFIVWAARQWKPGAKEKPVPFKRLAQPKKKSGSLASRIGR